MNTNDLIERLRGTTETGVPPELIDLVITRLAENEQKLDMVRGLRNSSVQYQERLSSNQYRIDNTVYLKISRDELDSALK